MLLFIQYMKRINPNALSEWWFTKYKSLFLLCIFRKIPFWFLQTCSSKSSKCKTVLVLAILISSFVAKWNLMIAGKLCPFLKCLSSWSPMPSFLIHARLLASSIFLPTVPSWLWLIFTISMWGLLFLMNCGQNYCYDLCLGKEFKILFSLVIIC